jgi:hypothetical protein
MPRPCSFPSVPVHGKATAPKLSDESIAPNLDQDSSFFYDPASKKLRRRFARYPDSMAAIVRFFDDHLAAEKELLAQLRAERTRN